MLGRIFNSCVFIAMAAYAIHVTPIKKFTMMIVLLMPMTVHQGMSYSYDVYTIGLSAILVAYSAKIAINDKSFIISKSETVLLVFISILLFQMKSHAYFLMSLLPWFTLILKKNSFTKKESMIIIKILLIIIMLSAFVLLLWSCFGAENYNYIPQQLDYINQEGYSIGYFLAHPLELFSIVFATFKKYGFFYIYSCVGEYLGWLDLNMPHSVTLIFVILLFIYSMVHIENENELSQKFRILFLTVSVITIAAVFAGMLLSWSPVSGGCIEGVQGRYFIPCLLIIVLVLQINKFRVNSKVDDYTKMILIMVIFLDFESLILRFC
jgi:uncharacterized membrane protein